jgi:hypothetical protein
MKNMRKSALAIFAGLCFSLSLHAATTGTLLLTGTEPAILTITVTTNPAAVSLALNTNVTNLLVGTVTEQSNDTAGYTVTLSSANALALPSAVAFLKSTTTADTLPYTIQYSGAAVTFPGTGAAATISNVTAKTGASGITNNITVSFSGASANLGAAIYTDTLTFSIIAK